MPVLQDVVRRRACKVKVEAFDNQTGESPLYWLFWKVVHRVRTGRMFLSVCAYLQVAQNSRLCQCNFAACSLCFLDSLIFLVMNLNTEFIGISAYLS